VVVEAVAGVVADVVVMVMVGALEALAGEVPGAVGLQAIGRLLSKTRRNLA
jgi:hypothetical protein